MGAGRGKGRGRKDPVHLFDGAAADQRHGAAEAIETLLQHADQRVVGMHVGRILADREQRAVHIEEQRDGVGVQVTGRG